MVTDSNITEVNLLLLKRRKNIRSNFFCFYFLKDLIKKCKMKTGFTVLTIIKEPWQSCYTYIVIRAFLISYSHKSL